MQIQWCLNDFKGFQVNSGNFRWIQGSSGDFRWIQGSSGEFRGVQRSSGEFRGVHGNSGELIGVQGNSCELRWVHQEKKSSTHHKILSDQVWKPWCYPTLICVYFFNCKQVGALQPKALIPWAIQPWPQFVYFFLIAGRLGLPSPRLILWNPWAT